MDKTTEEQVNSSFESPLWEKLSDEATAACIGGASGDFKKFLETRIRDLLKGVWLGMLS